MKPRAKKTAGFVVEELEEEILVYDPDADRAHCLNATASFIWRTADGTRDVAELARLLSETFGKPATEEIVLLALDRLQRARLLEDECQCRSPAVERPDPETETRRQALRRMARVGVTLPAVMTLALPSPLQAATQIAGIDCWQNPEENRGKCCTNGRQCVQWGRIGLCIGRRC